MPEVQGRLAVPGFPGMAGTPFAESQTAGAAAVNTITLAAVAGQRYAIHQIILHTPQITVVNGDLTVTNIRKRDGSAGTVTFRIVESATHGAQYPLTFFPVPLVAATDNLAVVVSLAAIGSGATSALTVIGSLF